MDDNGVGPNGAENGENQKPSHKSIAPYKFDKQRYLAAFRKTRAIMKACESVGVGYSTLAAHRKDDPEFDEQVREVQATNLDDVASRCMEIAADGYLEPNYYEGKVVGATRKYSPDLIKFVLRTQRPHEWSERYRVLEAVRDAGTPTDTAAALMVARAQAMAAMMPDGDETD